MRSSIRRFAVAALGLLAAACSEAGPTRITAPKAPNFGAVTRITVMCPSTVQVGGGGSCFANAYDSQGYLVSGNPEFWWSGNAGVLQVTSYGGIYGVAAGLANVYVQIGNVTSFTTVQVVTPPPPLPPLSISISGSTSITRQGSYTWQGLASNAQSGETITYRWDYSSDGGATWTQVGTSQYYTRTLNSGDPSFQLRLTETSSLNRSPKSTSATTSVTVSNPLQPALLSVTVGGPDNISVAGTYTWTAYPTGGVSPYSYVWEKSTDGGSTWSLLISTRYTYPIYTQAAEMTFGCGVNTTLRYRAKVTSSDGQTSYGYRTTWVSTPYC